MIYKPTIASRFFDGFLVLVMLAVIAAMIVPFINVLALSFSGPLPVSLGKVTVWPKEPALYSYLVILRDKTIWLAYFNTIVYSTLGTAIGVLVNAMLAYPLSIKTYGIRRFTSVVLTITMFFSGGMVPTYLVIQKLGMIDTIWAMLIPGAVTAYNIFVFRTFFLSIPDSLRESARIDGANDIFILYKIILPLSKPVLAVMVLWGIVVRWNDFLTPLLYLSDNKKYPLQIVLRRILYQFANSDTNTRSFMELSLVSPVTVQSAAIITTILPIICIYPFLQKYFTKGIMIGSIKG